VEEEKEQWEKQKLLQRASRMRLEQEEMPELTSLFLNSKCNMIRDKQILEKRMIRKELAEEEKRLDKMMEMEWEKGAAVQEELERQRRQEMMRQDLVKQVEQNAEEWVLRAEELYQEGQRLLEQMKREDRKAWEQKQEQQRQIHADIKHSNMESQQLKDQQWERERLEDERVLEQQRQKAVRAVEQEQLHAEKEKEKEKELLQELQAGAQHCPLFGQDALRSKLRQDPVYWEQWQRELEQAQRKAELKQWLRWNWLEQVAQQKLRLVMQVEQDCQEFRRVLRAQQELLEREQLEQMRRACQEHPPSSQLWWCIWALQQQRERERVALLKEGRGQEQEFRQRNQCLAQLGQQKLREFRATGMPDKYCAQVERR
ncbi:CFA45 protein, partial [Gymnorhina tibicen]|nr:CFA45 protein [Gymnorhina tibicen]